MQTTSKPKAHAVQVSRRYDAPRERVFDALVNPKSLVKWFAPNDEMTVEATFDPVPGGRYRVEMIHALGNRYVVAGVYEVVDSPSRIVFTWEWQDEAMKGLGETRVSISLSEIDGGTELALVHDGFPNEESAQGHNEGWSGCLWRLERQFQSSALQSFSVITALNRKLTVNAIEGIADDQLARRTSDQSNSAMWILGHIANNRAKMAQLLGADIKTPLAVFDKVFDDSIDYPGREEVMEFFTKATNEIIKRLPHTDARFLAGDAPFELPTADQSLLGALSFFAQHEAYHVGQLGIIRKQLGSDEISYA